MVQVRHVRIIVLTCLIAAALTCLLMSGCKDGASPTRAALILLPLPPTAVSLSTEPTLSPSEIRRAQSAAKHARIMAEQSRSTSDTGTAETPPTSVTAASAPHAAGSAPASPEPAVTAQVLTGGQTPLMGVWSGTADRLASYLLGVCPSPRFTVPAVVLAEYYVRYCAEAGLRADLLWAQMLHETGYGRYGGSVQPEQNNFAGIGATGGAEPGVTFVTAEAGGMAHVSHMVAYVYVSSPVPWANSLVDPRFDLVAPRGSAAVLADLDGHWAVPGTGYGQRIEDIARAINSAG